VSRVVVIVIVVGVVVVSKPLPGCGPGRSSCPLMSAGPRRGSVRWLQFAALTCHHTSTPPPQGTAWTSRTPAWRHMQHRAHSSSSSSRGGFEGPRFKGGMEMPQIECDWGKNRKASRRRRSVNLKIGSFFKLNRRSCRLVG